jgi:hypothetical protein
MFVAYFLTGLLRTKLKNMKKMTCQELLLTQPWTRQCYKQYLKYRGGPVVSMVQRWQPYYIQFPVIRLRLITLAIRKDRNSIWKIIIRFR